MPKPARRCAAGRAFTSAFGRLLDGLELHPPDAVGGILIARVVNRHDLDRAVDNL